MPVRITRLVAAAATAAVLVFPGSVLAADTTPAAVPVPVPVAEWQLHVRHMRSIDGNLGTHVRACVEMHGSMAGRFGPNGAMTEMMAGGMMR